MSQPDSRLADGGVLVQKPKSNVYTVMLVLSLVFILIGCFFLWRERVELEQDPAAQPPAAAPADAASIFLPGAGRIS